MILKTQFGFHQETKDLPYRRKNMRMFPEKFPSLDYKNLLSDLSDSENEVSFAVAHTITNSIYDNRSVAGGGQINVRV